MPPHRSWMTPLLAGALLLGACGSPEPAGEEGFAITLAETGEAILTDRHLEAYRWKTHRLVLSEEGLERWRELVNYNESFDPPIPQLGDIYRKEFIVSVEGQELYRGRFWSFASSLLSGGVLLYDVLGAWDGELAISFNRLPGETGEDPRFNPAVEEYFRKAGKLQ